MTRGIRGGQKSQDASLAIFIMMDVKGGESFEAGATEATLVCFDPPLQIPEGLEAHSCNEWVKELSMFRLMKRRIRDRIIVFSNTEGLS